MKLPKTELVIIGIVMMLIMSIFRLLDTHPVQAQPSTLPVQLRWTSIEDRITNSVAWGDVDNDGDLDLAVGNSGVNQVYLNVNGALTPAATWASTEADHTYSVAWGDIDNDGDLDLVAGNYYTASRLYRNNDGTLEPTAVWSSADTLQANGIALGDIDGDGDLDLAVASSSANRLFRNTGSTFEPDPFWLSAEMVETTSVAWGDMDGDGRPDLAFGNSVHQNVVYRNMGGSLSNNPVWSSTERDITQSIAWGDVDSDGDLDLAVGNSGSANYLYRNENGILTTTAVWESAEADATRSVAWGDVDGDGDLDLAVGNDNLLNGAFNRMYLNNGQNLNTSANWTSPEADGTRALAWGDVDSDGDLDLAVGNRQVNRLYYYEGVWMTPDPVWASQDREASRSVAWGDVDGDGDLDLAVGNYRTANQVYRNDNGILTPSAVWLSQQNDRTKSVAWADVDGDGDLDLATGGDNPIRLYINTNGALATSPAWSSQDDDNTTQIAWGDVDGDGDLDLIASNMNAPDRLYHNENGTFTTTADWVSQDIRATIDVAWGDIDSDGDLDLIAAGSYDCWLYRNHGGTLTRSPVWQSGYLGLLSAVAWGDVDGDGDLDLAFSTNGRNGLLRNDGGTLTSAAAWLSIESEDTRHIAWGDADNDGDLDLAVGNSDQPVRIYRNDNGLLTTSAAWSATDIQYGNSAAQVAWGDVDGDGDLDLAIANRLASSTMNRLYRNTRAVQTGPGTPPLVRVQRPTPDAHAGFYSAPIIHDGPTVTLSYTLVHSNSLPAREVIGEFSLDGGDHWQPATATSGTRTTDLTTSPTGITHSYGWDVFADGVMGRSDNVVFRLTALPDLRSQTHQDSLAYTHAAYSSSTFPFRVRGSQVRVVNEANQPVPGALVYRLAANQIRGARPFASSDGQSFTTDAQGYLQGRSQIRSGDQLVALTQTVARTQTENIDASEYYYTSATPTTTGLDMFRVTNPGVQVLQVRRSNPLILLNLDISLEWDARNDTGFLAQLDYDLRRASELLFDWTDGQVALGRLKIHHNRELWNDAHIRIYATNRLRPNANQGGIISEETADPDQTTLTYMPGQVRMGAIWNRFGESAGNLGEDWPRTLAHELGHFALFLDDNYLGLDDAGRLISVDSCPGAMSDPYRDDYSEFHPDTGWSAACSNTLSNRTTSRSDWNTITTFYNASDSSFSLDQPERFNTNRGPTALPLDVTEISITTPPTATDTLAVPIFYLVQQGSQVQPGGSARVFLFTHEGDRLTDLGSPVRDQITARGSHLGDRLCVYDSEARRLGCIEQIAPGQEQLELVAHPEWQPEILITPVTSTTIDVQVQGVEVALLKARLYPIDRSATNVIDLQQTNGVFRGTFNLDEPALDGYIQVWVDEPSSDSQPRREVLSDYAIGGNPGHTRTRRSPRGSPGHTRSRRSPAVSADGQVILFGDNLIFPEGEFFTVQAASVIPSLPTSRMLVGQGYWIAATAHAPDLRQISLNMSYLDRDVPRNGDDGIRIYFWDGTTWITLDTTHNAERNESAAQVQGPGLYALMTSIEIQIDRPGWNLFSYSARSQRPVAEALRSIDGQYTTVYGYAVTDTDDPWKVYDIDLPAWVNDLHSLEPDQGYWINATRATTLYLDLDHNNAALANTPQAETLPTPPAIYYGTLSTHAVTTGIPVIATIQGYPCGQSQTRAVDGNIVFAIDVLAADMSNNGQCGVSGRTVTIRVTGSDSIYTHIWENSRPQRSGDNASGVRMYLPFVMR